MRQSKYWRLKLVNYRQIAILPSSSGGFTGNIVNNPKNETCKVVKTNFGVVTRKQEAKKVKEEKN